MSERSPADVPAPLSVRTDLAVAVDGVAVDVDSTGERLLVQFRSLPDAVRAVRARPAGGERSLVEVLTATDLTAEFRVRDRIVAVAGADARPGFVARSLGYAPLELRIDGVLGAVGAEVRSLLSE